MVPADKVAIDAVVVRRLHYIITLKQELSGTKAYKSTSENEKAVINNHIFHNSVSFAVSVNEDQEKLLLFYWLPKLHKQLHDYQTILIAKHLSHYYQKSCY